MKILVCVKPVPDTGSSVRLSPDGASVQTDPLSSVQMSRYDELALEQALVIADALPDARIDVISVGPEQYQSVLKRALGMGADHGIFIRTETAFGLQPEVTAAWIAAAARLRAYDLILTGILSEDGMHGQVGPLLAEHLSLPCATAVVGVRITPDRTAVCVERVPAQRLSDIMEIRLPAVLTLQGCGRKPRYPSLTNILRAKGQNLEIISTAPLIHPEVLQETVRFKYPSKSRSGSFLQGSPQQKARELLKTLREKSFLD